MKIMESKIRWMKGLSVFLLVSTVSIISCTSSVKENTPPNIIIFLVDDMGLMDTSVPVLTDSLGNVVEYPLNDYYKTPNMEKLAEQGIRFSNFYAHSVCSPSRISLMSGQNSARHRATNWIHQAENNRGEFGPSEWNWEGLNGHSITLPRLLQEKEYRTIHIGKAHFGPEGYDGEDPTKLGFDINIGGSGIGRPGSYYGTDAFGLTAGDSYPTLAVPDLEKYHGKDIFLTEALTIEAKNAMTQAKRDDKPFFLNMSHYAVHSPFDSDPRFAQNYNDSEKDKKAQAYATLIEGIDKSLGDIISHVKKLGLDDNTLILFMGDNGSDAPLPMEDNYGSSYPLKGKKAMHWEGGMRAPFIATWVTSNSNSYWQTKLPIAQGVQHQIGTIIDIFPTITDMLDINIPEHHSIDGSALQKQLNGLNNKDREETFLNHFPHGHRSSYFTSLVNSDWKIIYHYQVYGEPRYELYNLKEDPFETNNLSEANPEQLKVMMQTLGDELEDKKALYPEVEKQSLELIMPK